MVSNLRSALTKFEHNLRGNPSYYLIFCHDAVVLMGNELLSYFKQTIQSRERYPNPSEIQADEVTIDRMMYALDGENAFVVQENAGSSEVDNSAAFLNQNFGDSPRALYEFLDGNEETLGFAGVYKDPDRSVKAKETTQGVELDVPAKAVFAFNPEHVDQYDIKIE